MNLAPESVLLIGFSRGAKARELVRQRLCQSRSSGLIRFGRAAGAYWRLPVGAIFFFNKTFARPVEGCSEGVLSAPALKRLSQPNL